MTALVVREPTGPTARTARIAALLYLGASAAAVVGHMVVPDSLVVVRDAAATAGNVLAQAPLFRIGIAAGIVSVILDLAKTVAFYDLFRSVDRSVSLTAVLISVVSITVGAIATLFQLGALGVLTGAADLRGLDPAQVQALAFTFLRLADHTYQVFFALFGAWCVLVGYLAYRSRFLPRVIGVLMVLTGLGYLVYLWPPLAAAITPFNLALAGPGELSLVFWLLLFKGTRTGPQTDDHP